MHKPLEDGDKTNEWNRYLQNWYPIHRRIISYLHPSTWPSSPLAILQRATLYNKNTWCMNKWYGNVKKTTPGWCWWSTVSNIVDDHRACFQLVEEGMKWGSVSKYKSERERVHRVYGKAL